MFGRAFTLGSVRGIDIRVDVSWIFIALLITWSFWARFGPAGDRHTDGMAIAMAVVGAMLFFGSILVHELAHALEAQRRGVTVAGITLFVFGGVTESRFDVRRPVDEFALTIVGPFASFVLAGVMALVAVAAGGAGIDTVADVAGLLAWINAALGVFNLLPGAPLDGGRVLRSLVWWRTNDRQRATRVAAHAGQVLGSALVAIGVAQFLLVPGRPVGGIWFALIGWFLFQAARAELGQAEIEQLLEGRTVGDLLPPDGGLAAPAGAPVDAVIGEVFARREIDAVIVMDADRPVGVLTADAVRSLPRRDRATTSVGDAMTAIGDVPEVERDSAASDVLEPVQDRGSVVVRERGHVFDVLTSSRMARILQRLTWLDGDRDPADAGSGVSGQPDTRGSQPDRVDS